MVTIKINEAKMQKHVNKRLERLRQQREMIDARIQSVEARLKNSERKKDVRRKILVGSYYLDQATKENRMEELKSIMDQFLIRNTDRTLFNLNLLSEENKG